MTRNKVIDYLHLGDVGVIELLVAMYPILGGYNFSGFTLGIFTLIILDLLAVSRQGKLKMMRVKSYTWLAIYLLLHDIIWFVVVPQFETYMLNSYIQKVSFLVSLPLISPIIRWNKLKGSINWVAIMCMIGMVVQFLMVQAGQDVNQITLPGLESGAVRSTEFYSRPHSFFAEPAGYALYMLFPLFIGLYERKMIWALLIALTVLMSTSTNGLVLIFVMYVIFLFVAKSSIWMRLFTIVVGGFMLLLLTNTTFFRASTDKFEMEAGRVKESARLAQGAMVVNTMQLGDYFFGAPYHDAYDYAEGRHLLGEFNVYEHGTGKGQSEIYMATFWLMMLHYGIVGVILYFMVIIIKPLKLSKSLWPLVGCIILQMFSSAAGIGQTFIYELMFIYAFLQGTGEINLLTGKILKRSK